MTVNRLDINFSPKTAPLEHQIEAINFIRTHQEVPLFDEQGLGKTKMVIDALCENIRDGVIDGSIIICKKTLIETWKKEILKHSNLLPVVLLGSRNQRGRSLLTFGHFYITNYESINSEIELLKLLMNNKKIALVLDESHRIKNPSSLATQLIFQLRKRSEKRIIISGTPIANRVEDIWSQFYFLDGGKLLGTDFEAFKKQYNFDLSKNVTEYREKLDALNNIIDSVSLRRTKKILQLPEKIFENVEVTLSPQQKIMYDLAKDELLVEIQNIDADKIVSEIDNYLEKMLRLTQIASNPKLLLDEYDEIPSKIEAMDHIVKRIIEGNEKVIIWTSFIGNIVLLKKRYSCYGSRVIYGDIPIQDRNISVDQFMNNPEVRVLIANPSAAKEGLTLTSSNNAIYLDRTFKMDDYIQSQDRIHRISQKRKCHIIKLIAKDTIDEYIDEMLEKKEGIARYTLGDSIDLDEIKSNLTKEDLIRILG